VISFIERQKLEYTTTDVQYCTKAEVQSAARKASVSVTDEANRNKFLNRIHPL